MAPKSKIDPDKLIDTSWGLLQEALDSGKITLGNGTVMLLEPDHIVRLSQWLASRRQTKPRITAGLEDFTTPESE